MTSYNSKTSAGGTRRRTLMAGTVLTMLAGRAGGQEPAKPPPPPPPPFVSAGALASTTLFDLHQVLQCRSEGGTPAGFLPSFAVGWAEVPIQLTADRDYDAVYLRLHDARDPAAKGDVLGSGAVLQPPVKIAAGLRRGGNVVICPVPGAMAWFFLELATDPDMRNAIRFNAPVGAGDKFIGGPGSSPMFRWFYSGYGYGPNPKTSQMVAISPFGVINVQGVRGDGKQVPWLPPADQGDPNNPFVTAAAAQFLSLMVRHRRRNCAFVGNSRNGATSADFMPAADILREVLNPLLHNASGINAGSFLCGANDVGVFSWRTTARRLGRVIDMYQALNAHGPDKPVHILSATPLWFGASGSDMRAEFVATRDVERTHPGVAIAHAMCDSGGTGENGHASQQGRKRQGTAVFREAVGFRGPRVVKAERIGERIRLTCEMETPGSSLRNSGWLETDPHVGTDYVLIEPGAITDASLAPLFAVYPAGKGWCNGPGLKVGKASIAGRNLIDLYPAESFGPNALEVSHCLDLDAGAMFAATGRVGEMRVITDDNDVGRVGYGIPLQQTFDPLYVPAVSAGAQSITVNRPHRTIAGSWIALSGGGTGHALPGFGSLYPTDCIEVQVDGGEWAVPASLVGNFANVWSCFPVAPAAPGVYPVGARIKGQPSSAVSTTVEVVGAREYHPGSTRRQLLAEWDFRNRATLWQDTSCTVPADDLQPVRACRDALGGENTLYTSQKSANPDWAPILELRRQAFNAAMPDAVGRVTSRNDYTLDRPALVTEGGTDPVTGMGRFLVGENLPVLQKLAGTHSMIVVHEIAGMPGAGIVTLMGSGKAPFYSWDWGPGKSAVPGQRFVMMPNWEIGAQRFAGDATTAVGAAVDWTKAPPSGLVGFRLITYDAATGELRLTMQNGATAVATMPNRDEVTFGVMLLGAAGNYAGAPLVAFDAFRQVSVYEGVLTPAQWAEECASLAVKHPGSRYAPPAPIPAPTQAAAPAPSPAATPEPAARAVSAPAPRPPAKPARRPR